MSDHTSVIVSVLPDCDFTHEKPVKAKYDGKTKMGPWANMCQSHFDQNGIGLGLGRGQKLIIKDKDSDDGARAEELDGTNP
jgi:hypothetical protein